jgi:dihydropteroate synthase
MQIAPRAPFTVPLPSGASLALGSRTFVMGVLNITPDSFSDGGVAFDPKRAIALAEEMEWGGADIIDIGAESTRPGASPVDAAEEWRRLGPVIAGLQNRVRVPLSIDTYRAETAARALDHGVAIVNDISGLQFDSELGAVVAASGAALVLMHTRGRPRDMYEQATYHDVIAEVARELQDRVQHALSRGIAAERLLIDPGLGFAKKAPQSLTVLAALDRFATLGRPLLVGPSRKSFLSAAAGGIAGAADRDWATAAAVTAAVLAGVHIVRLHRVADLVQVVRVADALRDAAKA